MLLCLKKNQNAPRPSERPPVRGKKFIVDCPYVFEVCPFLAQKQGGIPLFGEAPLNIVIGTLLVPVLFSG